MILEEQHQSPDGSSGAIVRPASSNDDENLSSVQVQRGENDGGPAALQLAQLASSGYSNQLAATTSTSSEYDEDEDDSSSGSSVAEDEDIPMDELGQRGWIEKQRMGSEVNGVALPGSDAIQIGQLHATNTQNMHIGQRVFIKSKGDVIIKSVNYTAPISPADEQKQALENGSIHSDKDGIGNFGSTLGPKLSTATDTSDNPLYPSPHGRVAEWCLTRRCTIIICVTALVLLLITVLAVLLSNTDPTIKGVRIVPRVEWGAQPPTKEPTKLKKIPPPYVIISHTASTFCYTQAQCVLTVRVAQTFHIESKGWEDIGYNFLVGGDGNVYEGRGWNIEGAHTFNYNIMSIGISFIGTFNTVAPTKAQVHAATKLIEFGVENGYISKDYKLLGHRQCVKTESPGEVLYNIIKTWDHWSPSP
ncbi:peptidoglycan-recognition protein LD isoform X4 [Nasonia vitripennis]|uniref:Uncharacterized protein n=1 Tax=Nasonia vitripennis TaxID=7425 RepID=A0A7M7ISY2_NASVI|nr:peptidoglycan-recognition protein LD isoform X4 [Nasonia vitripennis]